MRIAFFTPLNPLLSGISDYSEDLLPHLGRLCDIDIFTSAGLAPSNREIVGRFPCYPHSRFESMRRVRNYDGIVFQLGNAACHAEAYNHLLKYGGLLVLHELNISGIIGAKTLMQGDGMGFLRQVLVVEGIRAFMRVAIRFLVTKRFPGPNEYWMNRQAIRRSKGIIVHNEYMKQIVSAIISSDHLNIPVHKVPMGVPSNGWMCSIDPASVRAKLGLEPYDFVVSSFGVVHESKRISVTLRAFSRLLQFVPNAVYLLVGRIGSDYREEIKALGLESHVRMTDYIENLRDLYDYIAASDVCLNLRYPTNGETSGSLLRVMSMGKPAIVTNFAQFTEYPDDCCPKVDANDTEEGVLLDLLIRLGQDVDLRAWYGQNACRYVQQNHTLPQAAQGYHQALTALSCKVEERNSRYVL